jgi:hypothetical protein
MYEAFVSELEKLGVDYAKLQSGVFRSNPLPPGVKATNPFQGAKPAAVPKPPASSTMKAAAYASTRMMTAGGTQHVPVSRMEKGMLAGGQRMAETPGGVPAPTSQKPIASSATAKANMFKPSLKNPFAHLDSPKAASLEDLQVMFNAFMDELEKTAKKR